MRQCICTICQCILYVSVSVLYVSVSVLYVSVSYMSVYLYYMSVYYSTICQCTSTWPRIVMRARALVLSLPPPLEKWGAERCAEGARAGSRRRRL